MLINTGTPLWQATALGGTLPTIDLKTNQNSFFLSTQNPLKSTSVTGFFVATVFASTISSWGLLWGHFIDHDFDITLRHTSGTSAMNWHTNNDNGACQMNWADGVPVLYYATMTAGTSRAFWMVANGVTSSVTATNPLTMTAGNAPIYVGRSENGGEPFNGYVSEVLYFQTVLSSTQISTVVAYLRAKWNI